MAILSILPNSIKSNIELNIDPSIFISTWNTTLTSSGSSNETQIMLPLVSTGSYNFNVDWGDSSTDIITVWDQTEVTHNYAVKGEYILSISGQLIGWQFANSGDKLKITEISQWGNMGFGNVNSNFYGASNLNLTATDAPDLSYSDSLSYAFYTCSNLGDTGNMNKWDVSNVNDMSDVLQSLFI